MKSADSKIAKSDPRLEETSKMLERLQEALENPDTLEKIESDFTTTFEELGLESAQASRLYKEIEQTLRSGEDLDEIEGKIFDLLQNIEIERGRKNLVESLNQALAERAETIFEQVSPYLKGIEGRVLDFGAGDGEVAELIKNEMGIAVEGADIRDYRNNGVSVPIKIFDGEHLDVPDGTYQATIVINVLHHEIDNEKIIKELSRLVSGRLIIIETISEGESEEEMQADLGRTFLNDYLYNRLFHNADIPVPGTYETPQKWIDRFAKYGWHLTFEKDLGFDQPIIRDRHYLLVLDRIDNN